MNNNLVNQQEYYLQQLYNNRFDQQQRKAKLLLWKTLIKDFLQQHVNPKGSILDIGIFSSSILPDIFCKLT